MRIDVQEIAFRRLSQNREAILNPRLSIRRDFYRTPSFEDCIGNCVQMTFNVVK